MNPKDLLKEDVIAWLQANPNFFLTQPELLSVLHLPEDESAPAGATSLAQFQARRNQSELKKLQDQLKSLITVAAENERLMHRLHAMTLSLMTIEPLVDFFQALSQQLNQEFGAVAISLHFRDIPKALEGMASIHNYDANRLSWFDEMPQPQQAQCGRFTKSKLQALFKDQATTIRSAAVVSLDSYGLLAIGSDDQSKYQPQMGTLFLELLAATLRHRLQNASSSNQAGS